MSTPAYQCKRFQGWMSLLLASQRRLVLVIAGLVLFNATESLQVVAWAKDGDAQVWELSYERLIKRASASEVIDQERREDIVLYLSKDGFALVSAEQTDSYDASTKRVRQLNAKEKSFIDIPIHSRVWFNANELMHREALCNAFEASKVVAAGVEPCSKFELESLLSITLPERLHIFDGKTARIKRNENGSKLTFEYSGKEYVVMVPSSYKMTEEYQDSLRKFLILQCAIHPEIRQQLVEASYIPAELKFVTMDKGVETSVQYKLKEAHQVKKSDLFTIPKEFVAVSSDENLSSILLKLEKTQIPDVKLLMGDLEKTIDQEMKKGNVVDAVLAAQRYFVITDDSIGYRKALQRCGGFGDKQVGKVIYSLGNQNQLHELLHKVEISQSPYVSVVKYYMADLAMSEHLEEVDVKKMLVEALQSDPLLVGAYVDLSRVYQDEWDYYNAYRCIEAARKVTPRHSNLNAIKANEIRLERDFKDWF